MKKLAFVIMMVAFLSVLVPIAKADPMVTIYTGYTYGGDGSPYTNPVSSFTSPYIRFGTYTGWGWWPVAPGQGFGAQIIGTLNTAAAGNYWFGLASDDGSSLYVNGSLALWNPNDHGPEGPSGNIYLNAGANLFTLNFYENGRGSSGVDLYVPAGVTLGSPVPLPGALLLFGPGLVGLAAVRRRFKK
jgi:hypothetical protein